MITTLGRELVRRKLPDKFKEYADKPLDKKTLTTLTTKAALEDPDGYVQLLQDLNGIGEAVVTDYGRDAALSYLDAGPGKEVQKLNQQLRAVVAGVLDDDKLTEEQKENKIKDLGYRYTQKIQDAVFQDQDQRHTALASQINSGSRGNKTQLMQLMFGNMMMKDALNRDIPYLHMDPYMFGTSPFSYWVSASSGRKGFYDVQAATGQAGYLGKQVTNVTHDVVIEKDDCGTTDTGIPFKAADSQNIGHVLLRPFHNHPAGSVVTDKMVAEADDDEEMILRSPLTCKCKHGICAKCNGLAENGRFPGKGDYVALSGARAFVEKVTQSGISCLHPDTLVRMGDGSTKAIKDIRVGDEVLGVGADLSVSPVKVLNVFNNGVQPVWEWVFDRARLRCTDVHKVLWSDERTMAPITSCSRILLLSGDGWKGDAQLQSVEQPEYSEVMDLEVDNSTHWYLLANGIVTHNSKHTGGVGGKKVVDPDGEDQPTGFPAIERMFMAQSTFPGGAVLSPVDGTVGAIKPAPQGGHYITVGAKTIYCSPYRSFKVKPGDKVEAGDALTNGVPNPMEVVDYKDIGLGRKYYLGKLAEVFDKAGFGVNRCNLEAFTRAFLNNVQITDDDGYHGMLPGEIVNYSEAAANYRPRKNAVTTTPDKAVGSYLETPLLYFSIGTRITPSVAKELSKYGFNEVVSCPDPPPFKSKFLRPATALQHSRNWLPRLSGERLYDSLFDAAQQGITDSYDSTSYVDRIVASPFKASTEI